MVTYKERDLSNERETVSRTGSSVWQVVPGNRWDLLDVPVVGGWTPTLKVSVVLPYYQAPETLEITLAALSAQTYPSELLQVIVADDGSNPPLELPDGHRGLDLTVVHQEDLGFGASRARNNGARVADGEILVFLDADMVPEPWQVEAHARWHHACDHAVTLGFRRHVEFDGVGPDEVAAMGADGLAPLFADREQQVPEWIDLHMESKDDLIAPVDDPFRIVTSGNFGVRADVFWAVNGFDESFTQWGGEDTELGYRLFVNGALLVPDRQAQCWHQGHGHLPDESERLSLAQQRAKMAHLVAHYGFRRERPGRVYAIPRVAVEVTVGDVDGRSVLETVESVLANTFYDLNVYLRLPEDHPDYVEISREFEGDPRVHVGDAAVHPYTPHVMSVPAGVVIGNAAVGRLVVYMRNGALLGVVSVTPARGPKAVRDQNGADIGGPAQDARVVMARTRALGRARYAGAQQEDLLQRAGELFGWRELPASEIDARFAPVDGDNRKVSA